MRRVIELHGVRQTYPTDSGVFEALCGVDLSIDRGEMVALTGESGAGTSTLLNIIGCLDVPTAGRYLLDGADMGQLSRRQLTHMRAERIGIASPSFDLLPDASVLRNLELPLPYDHVESRLHRAHQALDQIGLDAHHDVMPPQLLPGQRYQVLIARAMINNPPILLYDQPSHELDPHDNLDIIGRLTELNHDGTTSCSAPPNATHRPRQPNRHPARRANHPRHQTRPDM